jgi:hypothetical protein
MRRIEATKTVDEMVGEVVALLDKATQFKRKTLTMHNQVGRLLCKLKQQLHAEGRKEFSAWVEANEQLPGHRHCLKF